ncbi:Tyrosine recombinase XerC [subsurface metagenome]
MSEQAEIIIQKELYKQQYVITLKCVYNPVFIKVLKELGAVWSSNRRFWYLPVEDFKLSVFRNRLDNITKISIIDPDINSSKRMRNLPGGYLELLQQKRYSPNTIKTYTSYIIDFVEHFHGVSLESLDTGTINRYILDLVQLRKISRSQQNQRINAIKFYYEKVLGREKQYYQIERPRKEKKLPTVLSREEIKRMLDAIINLKHLCIIELLYSSGLRRSELINLKIYDIDSSRILIKVKGSKGSKDRYVQLSQTLLNNLRKYYKSYHPKKWIFEGQTGGQYSAASVLNVVKRAAALAGIAKPVTPHTLRHSYATHHLEMGTDIRLIQTWLGHENLKTTEIYTHISENNFKNYRNPLDEIENIKQNTSVYPPENGV